jgi:hypothetical protein
MVTLLGFFFILTNVICLVIWMPDLVGPVRLFYTADGRANANFWEFRDHHGCTTVLPLVSGCTRLWTTWMGNKHEGQAHPVV